MAELWTPDTHSTHTPEPLTNPDAHEAYVQWCHEEGVDYRYADNFLLFVNAVRAGVCSTVPKSLVAEHAITFGGADGGAGVIQFYPQGEYAERVAELHGERATIRPLSQKRYFERLHNKLGQRLQGVFAAMPDETGTVLKVQQELVRPAKEIVESRSYFSSVVGVYPLTQREYDELIERQRSSLV